MTKAVTAKIVLFCISALLLSGSLSFANDIKSRMKMRRPIIDALKAQGIVGENHQGYVEYVGSNRAKEEVITAENNDREKVYAAIAKQQGMPADQVGRRRAMQIEKKSKPGLWFKDQNANWNKK